ncbi:hypothetical protein BZA77DRAFT_312285, partial [Pyronema omphalodes]
MSVIYLLLFFLCHVFGSYLSPSKFDFFLRVSGAIFGIFELEFWWGFEFDM